MPKRRLSQNEKAGFLTARLSEYKLFSYHFSISPSIFRGSFRSALRIYPRPHYHCISGRTPMYPPYSLQLFLTQASLPHSPRYPCSTFILFQSLFFLTFTTVTITVNTHTPISTIHIIGDTASSPV